MRDGSMAASRASVWKIVKCFMGSTARSVTAGNGNSTPKDTQFGAECAPRGLVTPGGDPRIKCEDLRRRNVSGSRGERV